MFVAGDLHYRDQACGPTVFRTRLVCRVADAIDRTSVVVGNQDRAIRHVGNVNRTADRALGFLVQEAFSEDLSLASSTVCVQRNEVDQVAARLGTVP